MNNRSIPLTSVIAYSLWLAGLTLAIAQLIGWADIGELGIVLAGAGATLNVRSSIANLAEREHAAFDYGREYERLHSVP